MKIVIRFITCLGVILGSVSFLHAETTETISKYRVSFERRVNQQLDDQGTAARKLRLNYIDALKKLKAELGRAENLKGVVQVMAEIEALEDGEEAEGLPAGADHRIKNLRNQWDRGMSNIRVSSNRKLNETVKIYLKALDVEKRRLTRVGRIKDALLFEAEEERVRKLPEVQASMAEKEAETEEGRNWKEFLPGRRYTYEREEHPGTRFLLEFMDKGKFRFPDTKDDKRSLRWRVTNDGTVVLSSPDWKNKLHLVFAQDGKSYEGKSIPGEKWRRGEFVEPVAQP